MVTLVTRILRSLFSLPAWVIIWMLVLLIPANLAGLFMLDTVSGLWITLLGAGGLMVNLIPLVLNRGFSRVLAIPHLLFWLPLELILLMRILTAEMGAAEWWLTVVVLVINGISLGFDIVDTRRWLQGERDVFGFEGEPVKI
ncbi:MAG: hypothetical protein AAGC96_15630 [Pseudomonadota bacterium]